MNFDAARLARLSGLDPEQTTETLTESKTLEENCGCQDPSHDHGAEMMTTAPPLDMPISRAHSPEEAPEVLFVLKEEEEAEEAEEEVLKEEEEAEEAEEAVEETSVLTMETLRQTVLELRDEIIAENELNKQTISEAPVRSAIRKEIKALLAEMPADAATNWMYGKQGKPASSHDKSRATTLTGVGFKNSKN
jgi:hypothetical protein